MSLTIAGRGVELEAVLREPDEQRLRGAVVVCHPHPLYGGTMDNKVVFRSAKAALSAGWAALRFNFRGVGKSTGTYDHGEGEKDDVRSALDLLAERYPEHPLALMGFSFGARVGLEIGVTDPRVSALVGLGLPLRMHDFDFLATNEKPTLLLSGALDEYCPPDKLEALARRLPPSTTVRTIDGADHFFSADLDPVQSYVSRFFLQLKPARGAA